AHRSQPKEERPPEPQPSVPQYSSTGIIVEGLNNCLVKFAKCCTPVPGDPVVGFITKGYGVSVHRADCPNAQRAGRSQEEQGRWVAVSWAGGEMPACQTSLVIAAKDRDGLTLDVTTVLAAAKAKVTSIAARGLPDGHATVTLSVEVKSREDLNVIINRLSRISGVFQVTRATG
ncbi:MAG: (p)ppGpp synthetase, partial [Oscillospiraceae bacterium]|nr:(p)ppGpp synthetase [Oscillospiraceae bacterium]